MPISSFLTNPPVLPLRIPGYPRAGAISRATIICGRQRRRKKGPTPVQTRPNAPPPPSVDMPMRHSKNAVTKPLDTASAHTIIQTLTQRRDSLILTEGPVVPGGVITVLTQRERGEHTVIIASTRNAVLTIAHEVRAACSKNGTAVIVAAGAQVPGAWQYPAMNANSAKRAVVVVATMRALFHHFLLNGHGRSWLKKLKFLIMVDPAAVLSVGAKPQISKVLRAMTPTHRRKNVVFSSRVVGEAQRDAVFLTERLLRTKRCVVFWNDDEASAMERECAQLESDMLQHETSLLTFINHEGICEATCGLATEALEDGTYGLSPNEQAGAESDSPGTNDEQTLSERYDTTANQGNGSIKHSNNDNVPSNPLCTGQENKSGGSIKLGRERLIVGDWSSLYKMLLEKLREVSSEDVDQHVVVIFTSARLAELYGSMCRTDGILLHDVHRRSGANKRERCLEWFYQEKRGILFATDVITGDVVLPDIGLVIMMGLPPQGIAGYDKRVQIVREDGEAWVMVGWQEADLIEAELRGAGRPVERSECSGGEPWTGEGVDGTAKGRAYLSWMSALLNERKRLGWVAKDVVKFANDWAMQLFGEIPFVPNSSVKHMPIRHHDGLRVTVSPPRVKPLNQARNTTRKPKNRFKLKPKDIERLRKIREMEERLAKQKNVVETNS